MKTRYSTLARYGKVTRNQALNCLPDQHLNIIEECLSACPPLVVVTELSSILKQFKKLMQTVLEFEGDIIKRRNRIEENVIVTQHYVLDLVPQSKRSHENYVKLTE